jgi:hypothetical protein
MAEVSLAQKPLEISVRSGANALAAQGRPFVAIARSARLMALEAMIAIDKFAGLGRLRTTGEWIGPGVLFGRNVVPPRTGSCDSDYCSTQNKAEDRKEATGHRAPPFSE